MVHRINPHDRQNRGYQETHHGKYAYQLAAVFERFRHHRIRQHGQHGAGGKSLGKTSICARQPVDHQVAQPAQAAEMITSNAHIQKIFRRERPAASRLSDPATPSGRFEMNTAARKAT